MSNFVRQINGVFTVKIDGHEHPNLVVDSGLSNIFKESSIASLCETLKVFNDDTEVAGTDTSYLSPVASSSNITNTVYGVSGTGASDYFFMKRTWTFSRGQIAGVINKLAVYSDDGSLYAAALLKTPEGVLDPVRPLFAPKVEITYESRWHFKQGDSYTNGTPVYFSDAGLVIVKTNMASKNDEATYSKMNEPFKILSVELFSDAITTDDSSPVASLAVVDPEDYSVTYIDNQFGVFGQKLNLVLPKTKYINDLPIASLVITTTRGKWQLGFEDALEKPTLSKREIQINVPFIHGTVSPEGVITPSGNPDAIDSIFTSLLNSTYSVSTRVLTYDDVGMINTDVPAFFGALKSVSEPITFRVPTEGVVTVALGQSDDIETYVDGVVEGILIEVSVDGGLGGFVEDVVIADPAITFAADDVVVVTVANGIATVENTSQALTYSTSSATSFVSAPAFAKVGVTAATVGSALTVY